MILSIIIVNYNTAGHLRSCLNSIVKYLNVEGIEIIVADNNSPDREIQKFVSEFSNVKFVFRNTNDGFGAGCNEAVQYSSGKYLLFLNPDIQLIDKSILKLVNYLDNHKETGIVSGLLVDDNNAVMYCFDNFPNLKWELFQAIGSGYNREIRKLTMRKEIISNCEFEVDWFHGAFIMLRKKDFDLVSGFNEKYFMYFEDVDLCYSIKNILLLKNICIPDVRIYHHTQSSLAGETTDNLRNFHMHRSKLLFIDKYDFAKKYSIRLVGMIGLVLRILMLPVWKKFKGQKKIKRDQLLKILKLYFSRTYLKESKFEYIRV